jgi:hypothetical protein
MGCRLGHAHPVGVFGLSAKEDAGALISGAWRPGTGLPRHGLVDRQGASGCRNRRATFDGRLRWQRAAAAHRCLEPCRHIAMRVVAQTMRRFMATLSSWPGLLNDPFTVWHRALAQVAVTAGRRCVTGAASLARQFRPGADPWRPTLWATVGAEPAQVQDQGARVNYP